MRRLLPAVSLASFLFFLAGCSVSGSRGIDRSRTAERLAVPSAAYPLAGFWKVGGCSDRWGLAIAPAGNGYYSVSFCGPGGCFAPGSYRPNSRLVGDANYRVLDVNTLEIRGADGFIRYVRCPAR